MSYSNGAGIILADDLRPNDVVRFEGSNEPLTVTEVRHEATTLDCSRYSTVATLRIGSDEYEYELDPTYPLRTVPTREARAMKILERRNYAG